MSESGGSRRLTFIQTVSLCVCVINAFKTDATLKENEDVKDYVSNNKFCGLFNGFNVCVLCAFYLFVTTLTIVRYFLVHCLIIFGEFFISHLP